MYAHADVIIIGGGCGGLWLLSELARSGYACVLVEHGDLGAFASTHGQNRLHSGAFYAIIGGDTGPHGVAQACMRGYENLRGFCEERCPGALDVESECLYLFETEEALRTAAHRVEQLGIDFRFVQMNALEIAEPLVQSAKRLRYALATIDRPFDAHRILQAVARMAVEAGGMFYAATTGLERITLRPADKGSTEWRLDDSGNVLEARVLVCATGALSPRILSGHNFQSGDMSVQRSLVMIIPRRVSRRIISVRSDRHGTIDVVPFDGGTTVTVGGGVGLGSTIGSIGDSWRGIYERIGKRLRWFLPGLVGDSASLVRLYTCEKLDNGNHHTNTFPERRHGARHYFWLENPENLFWFSPGKFTTASIAAREFAAILSDRLGPSAHWRHTELIALPKVAKRSYFGAPTHVMIPAGDTVIFEEIGG